MELVSSTIQIDFMKLRFVALAVSLFLIAGSLYEWQRRADTKYGVDFVGGTEVVVGLL